MGKVARGGLGVGAPLFRGVLFEEIDPDWRGMSETDLRFRGVVDVEELIVSYRGPARLCEGQGM